MPPRTQSSCQMFRLHSPWFKFRDISTTTPDFPFQGRIKLCPHYKLTNTAPVNCVLSQSQFSCQRLTSCCIALRLTSSLIRIISLRSRLGLIPYSPVSQFLRALYPFCVSGSRQLVYSFYRLSSTYGCCVVFIGVILRVIAP